MKLDTVIAFSGPQKQEIINEYGLNGGRTQKVIDSSFMGYLDKYMPMDSAMMIASMYNNTKVGSGEININVPYAHYQNEGRLYVDPKYKTGAFHDPVSGRYWSRKGIKKIASEKKLNYHGGANRGDHFTERMLGDHFQDILKSGQKEIDK